jgi:predicted DNA-binding protein
MVKLVTVDVEILRSPARPERLARRGGRATRHHLTVLLVASKLNAMVVHLKPETESRLKELSITTGRAPEELVEEAMAGYLAELAQTRRMLDDRYDEIKSGRIKPIDGEQVFNRIRRKSKDRRSP